MVATLRKSQMRRRAAELIGLPTLTDADAAELWAIYFRNRRCTCVRDRLVAHHMRWAKEMLSAIAPRFKLADPENAIGDCLEALALRIVPSYNGSVPFEKWAASCWRRLLIDKWRAQALRSNVDCSKADLSELADVLPSPSDSDHTFRELLSELSPREAAAVWLRFYAGLSHREIGEALATCEGSSKRIVCMAIRKLRESVSER